ncbi:MAG: hypothetical protein ACE5K0_12160 [Candidatus Methanofastidiosia archaeon]
MFDPLDFFKLAKELAVGDEASIRTSIGRAYYASFLITRDKLELELKIPEVHQKVVEILYKKYPSAANNLHQLRRLRNLSDYDTKAILKHTDSKRALKLASVVIEKVSGGL